MFTAMDSQHKLVLASEHTGDRQCYCPGCGEKVIFKQGVINQAHFAHGSQSLCQTFSEGETAAHLEGKLLIYEWLKKEGIQVELEAYLPELNQRPDLLVRYEKDIVAIEFQCSPISKEKIRARTVGYVQKGIKVIWILGESLKIKRTVNSRQYPYLSVNKTGTSLLFQLDANRQRIEVYRDIRSTPLTLRYDKDFINFTDTVESLTDIFKHKSPKHRPIRKNRRKEEKELAVLSYYKDAKARPFFEQLYCNGMRVSTLPDVLFYSLSKEWIIKTLSYHWKLMVIVWMQGFKSYQVITRSVLARKINEWKKAKEISFHFLPDKEEAFIILPFLEFLSLLTETGYLNEVGNEKWVCTEKPLLIMNI